MRRYYAKLHIYGTQVCDTEGNDICTIKRFEHKSDRDTWAEAGSGYCTSHNYREACSAKEAYKFQEGYAR